MRPFVTSQPDSHPPPTLRMRHARRVRLGRLASRPGPAHPVALQDFTCPRSFPENPEFRFFRAKFSKIAFSGAKAGYHPGMARPNYEEYLKSATWQARRRKLTRHYASKCFCCGAIPTVEQPLDLHHVTYARLGRERPGDLVAVCRSCHDLIHGYPKSAGTIGEITLRVRDLMASKADRADRRYQGAPVEAPGPHITVVPAYDRQVRVHPGSRGSGALPADYMERQKKREAESLAKQRARSPWHF